MSDEPKDTPVSTTAPAVHSDKMWETPPSASGKFVQNLDVEPVYVETKSQFFDELNKRGMRLKDQQESTTGPEREIVPEIPLEFQPTPPPDPITQSEAHLFGAMRAFFLTHGITEAVYCDRCFSRKRESGCDVIVNSKRISVKCRCGVAEYLPPTGTTDLVLEHLGNTTQTEGDWSKGIIRTKHGQFVAPTVTLSEVEGVLVMLYMRMLRKRDLEPRWFCRPCWDGSLMEDAAMGISVTSDGVAALCPKGCRMLVYRATRVRTVH